MTDWQPLPSDKSFDIDNMFKRLYGIDRKSTILGKGCVSCGQKDLTEDDFRDELSLREYHISGLCQSCQDTVFMKPEEQE